YLVVGEPAAPWALAAAAVSTVATLVIGLGRTEVELRRARTRHAARTTSPVTPLTVAMVTLYSALAAIFLLHAQVPYLSSRLDIVLAIGPLLAGMGVVEWRARRYVERAPAQLARAVEPADFARRMVVRLVVETGLCAGAVAALALPLLAAMAWRGPLD